jgi:tripartite-type tricarboxylate transporter receptor subunit TctC
MTNVPFAKPAERYASPIGKHTDAIYEEPGDVAPFLQAGKQLRPLVVFDDVRHAAFKDTPASKELGFQISDLPNFRTLAVSAKTPPERVKVLADAVNAALDTPEWKKFCTRDLHLRIAPLHAEPRRRPMSRPSTSTRRTT